MADQLILTLSCPDRRGIVHAVSGFLLEHGNNIVEARQFEDRSTGLFFMRVQFTADGDASTGAFADAFTPVAAKFGMQFSFHEAGRPVPTAILVSRQGHCLNDLLFRWTSGLLPIDIRAIVSNHRDFYQLAASYNIPFHEIPVTPGTKPRAEGRLVEILEDEGVELVVLARYMQILSEELCERLAGRAINIHHSFLPGFKGARPYHQAYQRGVKLVGATAHFVTADLDEGPIIEQDVARVDHAHTVGELTRLGQDTERLVLARAVRLWSEDRVMQVGTKTVIF